MQINYLIYAYLVDAGIHLPGNLSSSDSFAEGFEHAAYNLRSEARLDASVDSKVYVQRHALVELLGKALLYVEVESHFREDGKAIVCNAPFSLLKTHVCSNTSRRLPDSANVSSTPEVSDATREAPKRKAAKGRESGAAKRAKSKRAAGEDEGWDFLAKYSFI